MLQESFLFWRIKKGGVGLPVEGMPWKSAMPRWELEMSDEDIWKGSWVSMTAPVRSPVPGTKTEQAAVHPPRRVIM
ncbi:MAG: hypothetical protein U0231_10395 [Nitrospiraceae bacterium]